MKAIFGAVAILAGLGGTSDAKTVYAGALLNMHPSSPNVFMAVSLPFTGVTVNQWIPQSSPVQVSTSVLARAWFPDPLTSIPYAGWPFGVMNRRNWSGQISLWSTGLKTYAMTGTLSAWNPGGQAHLTFASDGTWSCSGNCNFYVTLPRRTVQSPYGWGSGTFTVATAPIPAGAVLGLSGLLAMLGMKGRKPKPAKG